MYALWLNVVECLIADALKHQTQCTHHESTVVNKNELTAMDWSPDGRSEEMKRIDEENQKRIAGMTEEQILDEQRDILESSGDASIIK